MSQIITTNNTTQKVSENEKSSQNFQESLDKIIKREGFVSYAITNTKIALTGGSYLGTLHEVDLKGKSEHGEKNIHLFIKQILPDAIVHCISLEECYEKECYAYKRLFKVYNKMQETANVPTNERFKSAKSFEETNNTTIILENLSRQGYNVPKRTAIMSLALAELTIKQMSKFHGLSIALEKQEPEYFNANIKSIKYSFKIDEPEAFHRFVENMFNISKLHVNEESKTKLQSTFFQTYKEDIQRDFRPTKFLNCLCHGDYKHSNTMIKEIDGEIMDVIVMDYQTIHYGNPINDFVFCILLGTDREFRIKHLEHLKNLYYESLKSFLIFFDLDLNFLFPKAEFENQFKGSLRYYLLWSMISLPLLLASEEEFPDLEKDDLSTMKGFKINSQINTRLQEVVDECIEWGVI